MGLCAAIGSPPCRHALLGIRTDHAAAKRRTVKSAVAMGSLAAALYGSVAAIGVALNGRSVTFTFLMVLVAIYLLVGAAVGASIGLTVGVFAPPKTAKVEGSGGEAAIRRVILLMILAVTGGVLAERLRVGDREALGESVSLSAVLVVVSILLIGWIAARKKTVCVVSNAEFVWTTLLLAIVLPAWGWVNSLYVSPWNSATSLAANAAFLIFAVAFGKLGSVVAARVGRILPSRAVGLRHSLVAAMVGTGVSLAVLAPAVPQPLRRAGAAVGPLTARDSTPNVILVVLDTVRADHLSAYAYHRKTSPHLHDFANQSVRYTQAVAPSSWTHPSHASMMTGLMPSVHGARYYAPISTDSAVLKPLANEYVTLAERLEEAGFSTGAIIANHGGLRRELGLAQGFGHYDERARSSLKTVHTKTVSTARWIIRLLQRFSGREQLGFEMRDAEDINRTALSWLDSVENEPFFLFINYADAHAPYRPHPEWHGRLGLAPNPVVEEATSTPENRGTRTKLSESMDRYDGEIAYLDHRLGELFQSLRSRGLFESTLIIVTSDHGEAFGEHGYTGHFNSVYQEEVHVPLIIRYPGGMTRGTVDEPTSLTAVYSLVLDEVGLGSIASRDHRTAAHLVLSELHRPTLNKNGTEAWVTRALYEPSGRKTIMAQDREYEWELYDLATDPGELENLAVSKFDIPPRARDALLDWAEQAKANAVELPVDLAVSQDILRELRSLGYVD